MENSDISRTIKQLRRNLGVTQEQLAAKIGVTFSTINRWENKRGQPSPLAKKMITSLNNETQKSIEIKETKRKFYTIGYGGRNPQEFTSLLQQKGIKTIVDTRLRPQRAAMGSYVKAKSLEKGINKLLNNAGIEYVWLEKLGNVFMDDKENGRQRYAEYVNQQGHSWISLLQQIQKTPFCLMCAEKKVKDCHRQQIANYLTRHGWEVEHLE